MSEIRIVVADDHTIVREGIRLLLESLPGFHVVAEAADGLHALELVRAHTPDILLADIAMPGLNGLALTRRLVAESLPTRVVILSMHSEPNYIHQAIQDGAKGYVLKGSALEELEIAIRAVNQGGAYLSTSVTGTIVQGYLKGGTCGDGAVALTPRQREVLRLIAEGETTKAIANLLGISAKTVETHRMQLMDRLQIYEIAGLVRYAIRTGLVSSED